MNLFYHFCSNGFVSFYFCFAVSQIEVKWNYFMSYLISYNVTVGHDYKSIILSSPDGISFICMC